MGTPTGILQSQNLQRDSHNRRSHIERARKLIFQRGSKITSSAVENLLASKSWVPTTVRYPPEAATRVAITDFVEQNAFSTFLFPRGKDFYELFVPVPLHDIELGTWKALLIHLVRILYAVHPNGKLVIEFNKRYVMILRQQQVYSLHLAVFAWCRHLATQSAALSPMPPR
jgi:hypothetical protein